MGTVHKLLEEKGKQGVLQLGMLDRREVETAAAYMADEDAAVGFLYSGWCYASLPHRKLPDSEVWQIRGDKLTLLVEPGNKVQAEGPPTPVGVPYGSRARLILLYLQSEALRTNSREVELGRSLSMWLGRLGISTGGKSFAAVRDQAERLARCRISFHMAQGTATGLVQQNIVDSALFLEANDDTGRTHFLERARLSEGFFQRLKDHPVPLVEAAVRALSNNSMALDIYTWLAYRLHAIAGPRPITFKALRTQFGAGFARSDNFRTHFSASLRLALAVYPEARVEIDEGGLVLRPSPAPVATKDKAVLL
jgi:replication initiator protein